ncbi:GNAT family N-acetyltransferase [uncultured Oxalicibacterium sp.]|uniref:GNAT family N-acetyltransferase n=1 Tax=uncultured Oxalicibacterium sp. TaxID=1168540 RepID=UPI0025DB48BA|nr:GNAT family N-acetyltransferase [uncultured Oxalicibacterium sp.]
MTAATVPTAGMSIAWQWAPFDALDGVTVHAMLQARQQVFVLEQQCLYADIDALDLRAHHLLGWHIVDGVKTLVAYLRCIAPGDHYAEIAIGRVLTVATVRNQGLGLALMTEGIRQAEACFPGHCIRISAQAHLARFYGALGFERTSDIYLEDDIPHIAMLRE